MIHYAPGWPAPAKFERLPAVLCYGSWHVLQASPAPEEAKAAKVERLINLVRAQPGALSGGKA